MDLRHLRPHDEERLEHQLSRFVVCHSLMVPDNTAGTQVAGRDATDQAAAGSKRSFSGLGGTCVGYSRVKHARHVVPSGSVVASCIPSTER